MADYKRYGALLVQRKVYEEIKKEAKKNKRKISGQVEYLLEFWKSSNKL